MTAFITLHWILSHADKRVIAGFRLQVGQIIAYYPNLDGSTIHVPGNSYSIVEPPERIDRLIKEALS